ncbi:MAG: hypothetical protein H6621_05965 [Halobacteriovoraceae bacterium]|nr:hypothetical protein [Halobacteriovoraceae bacterium]
MNRKITKRLLGVFLLVVLSGCGKSNTETAAGEESYLGTSSGGEDLPMHSEIKCITLDKNRESYQVEFESTFLDSSYIKITNIESGSETYYAKGLGKRLLAFRVDPQEKSNFELSISYGSIDDKDNLNLDLQIHLSRILNKKKFSIMFTGLLNAITKDSEKIEMAELECEYNPNAIHEPFHI